MKISSECPTKSQASFTRAGFYY